jgi:TRAP-type C4-dicarboxylate transport system permease small subunit
MKILQLIDKVVEVIERYLIIIFLTLMVVLTFFNILLRSLYTHGHIQWANAVLGKVDWSEPFTRLLVLWVTFLGASLLTKENRHIKIDIMRSLIPKHWLAWRDLLISLSCLIICVLMVKASIAYTLMEIDFGSNLLLGIPAWICQLILPLGFAVMAFRFFLEIIGWIVSIIHTDYS